MRVTSDRDLGNLVRERRIELGMTQGALAQRAGASRVTVNKVEMGHSGVELSTVLRLLGALDLMLAVEPRPPSSLTRLLGDYVRTADELNVQRFDDEPNAKGPDIPLADS